MRDSASGIVAAEVLPEVTMSRATIGVGQPDAAGERVDDAQVGLVRDEGGDVLGRDAGALGRPRARPAPSAPVAQR